jgi:indole-3-glycerol phosphate synthase
VHRSATPAHDILARIVATKRREVAALRPRSAALRNTAEAMPVPRDFAGALRREEVALIAEYKRRSPSAGPMGGNVAPEAAARAYEDAGAAALSVLTDGEYFGGSLADLAAARSAVGLPVLRKDFVVDDVQVWEARAGGADAILLIVRILDDARLASLQTLAAELGMATLVEVHTAAELDRALVLDARVIGVNNRDLATFTTDLGLSLRLAERVPLEVVLVAESGIRTAEEVDRLGAAGVDAILVGETLMRGGPESKAGMLAHRPRAARARAADATST